MCPQRDISRSASGSEEATITARVRERPSLDPDKVRQVRLKHILYRFLSGAVTSIGAGVVTIAFGPRAGGIFLAFPAILAASLSLIAQEEDRAQAREDSRGAVLGAAAMAAFAAVAFVALGGVSGAPALVLASATWLVIALGGYVLLWLG